MIHLSTGDSSLMSHFEECGHPSFFLCSVSDHSLLLTSLQVSQPTFFLLLPYYHSFPIDPKPNFKSNVEPSPHKNGIRKKMSKIMTSAHTETLSLSTVVVEVVYSR